MGYVAPTWQNGGPPALNAKNMQDISDNLAYVSNNMVNPNLLINWYFGNPVNQRGQTSYTGAGYGIDRWQILSSGVILAISDGCITISNTEQGKGGTISEKTEVKNTGSHVVMSVLLKNGTLFVTTGVPTTDATLVTLKEGLYAGFRVSENNCLEALFYFSGVTVTQESIVAIKLELGSQQTLAHQENGVWALNEIPDYGEQLRRCQRYYQRLKASSGYMRFGISQPYTDTAAGVFIPLQGEMRTAPTMSSSGNFALFAGSAFHGVNLSLDTASPYNVTLKATGTGLPGTSSQLLANADTNAYIEFSADL